MLEFSVEMEQSQFTSNDDEVHGRKAKTLINIIV